jgi:hypothetical protein
MATGFAIAAATPGIIIPMISKFKGQGYSKKSGVLDSVVVGASLDDITAIALFLVFYNLGVANHGTSGASAPL